MLWWCVLFELSVVLAFYLGYFYDSYKSPSNLSEAGALVWWIHRFREEVLSEKSWTKSYSNTAAAGQSSFRVSFKAIWLSHPVSNQNGCENLRAHLLPYFFSILSSFLYHHLYLQHCFVPSLLFLNNYFLFWRLELVLSIKNGFLFGN